MHCSFLVCVWWLTVWLCGHQHSSLVWSLRQPNGRLIADFETVRSNADIRCIHIQTCIRVCICIYVYTYTYTYILHVHRSIYVFATLYICFIPNNVAEHDLLDVAKFRHVLHRWRTRLSHLWDKFNFTFLIHLQLPDFIHIDMAHVLTISGGMVPLWTEFSFIVFFSLGSLAATWGWHMHFLTHVASALIVACACRIRASSNWAVGKLWNCQVKKNQLSHRPKTVPGLQREIADQNWRRGRVMFSVVYIAQLHTWTNIVLRVFIKCSSQILGCSGYFQLVHCSQRSQVFLQI